MCSSEVDDAPREDSLTSDFAPREPPNRRCQYGGAFEPGVALSQGL